MEITAFANKYNNARYNLFRWRYKLETVQKFALALAFAAFTGIMAQVRFFLPFTPVPVTGQVFAVLLSGVLLGKWYGGYSQGLYAALGGAGVPWFNGWTGGISALTGVTGGYIVGFILAATFIGWFTDRYVRARTFQGMLALMMGGVAILYTLGALHLSFVLGLGFEKTIVLGVLPFIPADIFKAAVAAGIASAIAPKVAYNGEVDKGYKPRKWIF